MTEGGREGGGWVCESGELEDETREEFQLFPFSVSPKPGGSVMCGGPDEAEVVGM